MFHSSRFSWVAGIILFFCLSATVYGQKSAPVIYPDDPIDFKNQFVPKTYHPEHITKRPGHYTITDWDEVIDETWGWGQPKAEKLQIFDIFWETIDEGFACFNGIDDYWDSLRDTYRTEIETGDPTYGVSRGRLAGIMHHLSASLRESHTQATDMEVSLNTSPDPGVPLMYVGAWGNNWHFGAGLTPLPDNSLLVYKTVPGHPLGLEPGDIVLGYDNIPWNDLYAELLEAQLPMTGWWVGSCSTAFDHSMLIGAGMNWHLFDTIDILKYSSGETQHLSTSPLIGQVMDIWCTEQMDIPGVLMPDYDAGERASFGIIDGTQIGYIYVIAWSGNVQAEFYQAVYQLMNNYETTGLIIDFRTNYGGNMFLSNQALSLLFNTNVTTIDFAGRCEPDDHIRLCAYGNEGAYVIPGNPSSYYDKPIAVLTGPGALSSGDQVAFRFKFHPMARFFGKSTSTAFNAPTSLDLGDPDWYCLYAPHEAYLYPDINHYLTHREFEVDEDIWLTPDDVAQGYDTVVEAAVAWINHICGDYVIGDYNGNEDFNIADIIAAFSKLQTGSPDPAYLCECPYGSGDEWAVAMDVNNNCAFNIADVIAGFSKLQTGSPELVPCELCPPGSPSPRNPDRPLTTPSLESNVEADNWK